MTPSGPFFGELYLRTTLPFLSPEVTRAEVAYLDAALAPHAGAGPVVDLGCGHGRHAAPLCRSLPLLVGVDLDPQSLAMTGQGFPAICADLFRLPFDDGALAAAYSWYSTLFSFPDPEIEALFREISRCLRSGGLLVFHTFPLERAASSPCANYDGVLPDGSRLTERCQYNPATGRDEGVRELTSPDGKVLSGNYFVRYFALSEHQALLERVGLSLVWAHGALDGSPPGPGSTELIIGARKGPFLAKVRRP